MNNRVINPDSAHAVRWTNDTGAEMASGVPTLLAGNRYGITAEPFAIGAEGVLHTAGVFELPKVDAVAFTQDQTLYWDAVAGELNIEGGIPIGRAYVAAGASDATAQVRLFDLDGAVKIAQFEGDASSAGLEVDLLTGVVPAMFIVQSRTAAGVLRSVTSVVPGTAGDAGKLTIVTSAGVATDLHAVTWM